MFYITGDTHGDFGERLYKFDRYDPTREDTLIILGDAGINYTLGQRDIDLKRELAKEKYEIFCIHGNHEERPFNIPTYKEVEYCGGIAYQEPEFPNLIFGKDGEIYNFDGNKTIVIGGAYSVDKDYRLSNGWKWFPSEQPSDETKAYVEAQLESVGWKIDIVLSHTVPHSYEPTERFLPMIDQSKVDKSTELWLDEIEQKLDYKKWYAGHFHCSKRVDKLRILYKDIRPLATYTWI